MTIAYGCLLYNIISPQSLKGLKYTDETFLPSFQEPTNTFFVLIVVATTYAFQFSSLYSLRFFLLTYLTETELYITVLDLNHIKTGHPNALYNIHIGLCLCQVFYCCNETT